MTTSPDLHPAAPVAGAPPRERLDVYVAGLGNVGGTLLDQIAKTPSAPVRVVGACTRQRSVLDLDGGLDPFAPGLEVGPPDWPAVLEALSQNATSRPTVFVDATGAPEVADWVVPFLEAGVSVVTPSKLANTRGLDVWDRLQALSAGPVHYRYETTAGAGLPVVRTIEDLVATGDRVRSVRGVLSGTMTYLFGQIERGASFSTAARWAYEQGYAEPDVRDDLSGEDVARKLLILARAAGLRVERSDVEVESLVPAEATGVPVSLVTDALGVADQAWADRVAAADAQGKRLRYVGALEGGPAPRLRVGVEAVPASSPLGGLSGTDNLVEITTDRYAASPVVVQGPGAGPAVTAGGVFADVLAVARAVL